MNNHKNGKMGNFILFMRFAQKYLIIREFYKNLKYCSHKVNFAKA